MCRTGSVASRGRARRPAAVTSTTRQPGRSPAAAWPGWAETSLTKRADVLFAFRELIKQRRGDLAELISSEHGKVTSDAAGEVARGLEVVEFACGIPHLLKGGFSE